MDSDNENPIAAEIRRKIEALPENVRALIYSAETSSTLRTIGAKHQLHIDQIGMLETETTAAMMGVTRLEDLAQNLEDSLNIPAEKAAELTKDINDQLFIKIRESMKDASRATEREAEPQKPLAAQIPLASTPQFDASPSVAMPSASKATEAPEPALVPTPTPIVPPVAAAASISTPLSTPVSAPKPATPDLSHEESMLSEKKVSAATAPTTIPASPASATPKPAEVVSADAGKPQNYKADPYREPLE
jgi:chemotaxis protein histidine kinase CheA